MNIRGPFVEGGKSSDVFLFVYVRLTEMRAFLRKCIVDGAQLYDVRLEYNNVGSYSRLALHRELTHLVCSANHKLACGVIDWMMPQNQFS